MDRHFCVTTYVMNRKDRSFLMILHRKLNKWVPPGGHIDPNELPDVAAVREAFEETGIEITLLGPKSPAGSCLTRPYGIQHNVIKESEHEHLDLIYLAIPLTEVHTTNRNQRESLDIGWFSIDEINAPEFSTFETVREWSNFFAKELL